MQTENLIWKPVGKFCGIYKLILDGEIQYIGYARNVKRRVGEHRWERRIEFNESLAAEVPLEEVLSVERALIRHHTPPYNVNCVGWELRGDRVSGNWTWYSEKLQAAKKNKKTTT